MRREEYERTYGRRGLHPPVPSSHSSRRSKKSSKRKMKCLISIGLILPALAAVIGVAAWAVSADVVMNSGSNRVNKADNQLLQGINGDRNINRGNVFGENQDLVNLQDDARAVDRRPKSTTSTTTTSTTTQRSSTTSTTTTTTTTTAATPSNADVSAILSKLISASGAASGGNGPRFVVVAPLPDHAELVSSDDKEKSQPSTTIARADGQPPGSSKYSSEWKPTRTQPETKFERPAHDLMASESQAFHQIQPLPYYSQKKNITSRVGLATGKVSNQRQAAEPSFFIDLSKSSPIRNFNSQPVEISGLEHFVGSDSLLTGASSLVAAPPKIPGFAGPFTAKPKTRGSQPGFYGSQRDTLIVANSPVFSETSFANQQVFEAPPPPPPAAFGHGLGHGFGLKPIQQHLHDANVPPPPGPRPEESKRWGAVAFPPGGGAFVPEPPKSISVSIASPTSSHSSEAGSVIKSFFLPFLPKPKLNMNARVVFGVVLDKGMGFGGAKKDAGHLPPHRLY